MRARAEAIGRLLSTVAPETMQEDLAEDPEERIEQILGAAHRCVDFELLSASAILEGQSDMLAAFFAQLFLVRPNLAAKLGGVVLGLSLRLPPMGGQGRWAARETPEWRVWRLGSARAAPMRLASGAPPREGVLPPFGRWSPPSMQTLRVE